MATPWSFYRGVVFEDELSLASLSLVLQFTLPYDA